MAIFRKDTHTFLTDNKTLFETVMIADEYGNIVGSGNPSGMAVDAFGRARASQPVTLFDSFNRYNVSAAFATSNTATANTTYNANTSTVLLNVDTTSGAAVVRETTRVFAYQPGKSLQTLATFVFNAPKTNLRQRVGYFNTQNGVFLEQDGAVASFVIRSYGSGSVVETRITQANWNIDPLNGSGPSLLTLDLTKAHIMFTDVEWLGVGSVRCGFVINGKFIHCHTFHHANIDADTYMTTACLPVRYEIENTGTTASASTLKQICSAVISEGGYELRGSPRSIGLPVGSPKTIATAGTYIPVIAIRLKSANIDSIVIPINIGLLGIGNNTRIAYQIIVGASLTGASWTSAGTTSPVEYDSSATAYSGGTIVKQGYAGVTNQSVAAIELDGGLFKYQLERNGLTTTPTTFLIVATGAANGDAVLANIDWEEI
jgi:hypothetical protein